MVSGCFSPLMRFKRQQHALQQEQELLAQAPDQDRAEFGLELAQFASGSFWGLELAFQRVPGVTKTEVGYSQGYLHAPSYRDVADGVSGHAQVVRLIYDPSVVSYESLIQVLWRMQDPTSPSRQGSDVYRSGIYYYTSEQAAVARELIELLEKEIGSPVFTEVLPAKRFYRAEPFHQQYLAKGGRFGFKQSAAKKCTDRIRPYG